MDCGLNPACWAGEGIGAAIGGAIEDLAKSVSEALGEIVTTLATFWVALPTSNLTSSDGVSPAPTVAFLQGGLWYWTATLAVLAVILGGTRLVWEQRGAPIREVVRSLLTLTLVSGMGLAVIAFLITAADGFSSWIIDQATDGAGFGTAIQGLLLSEEGDTAVFMVIIVGLLGILTSITQIVLMVIRSGMLVILAGILPTTAAFTNTEMGKQWFQKTIGWTIAFILYKPAAAIVYAVAFRLVGGGQLSGATGLLNTITGLALMVVALLALPALLRFVAPMVGAVASGGGGSLAAGAGAAALAAIPSGARSTGSAGRGNNAGTSSVPTNAGSDGGGNPSKSSPSGSSSTSSGGGGGPSTHGSTSGGRSAGVSGAGSQSTVSTAVGGGPGGAAPGGGASRTVSGARAGATAGPAGMAAGAAVSAASRGVEAGKQVSSEAAGDGPSGSTGQ